MDIQKEIRQICNCSGPVDMLHFFMPDLPKIEFDDLKKLEAICSKNPNTAHRIVKGLISFNTQAFYKLIREILKENGVISEHIIKTIKIS